jgi:hypothetical protein
VRSIAEDRRLALDERKLGVTLTLLVAEFDLEDFRREDLDNRAELSTPRLPIRRVGGQGDDVE